MPEHIDLYHLHEEAPATDQTGVEAVVAHIQEEAEKLEQLSERIIEEVRSKRRRETATPRGDLGATRRRPCILFVFDCGAGGGGGGRPVASHRVLGCLLLWCASPRDIVSTDLFHSFPNAHLTPPPSTQP
jgi:hypothetical protein